MECGSLLSHSSHTKLSSLHCLVNHSCHLHLFSLLIDIGDKKAAKKSILVKIASSSRPSSHAAIIKPRMLSVYFYEVGVYLECSVDI
ncbi:hypothetical protein OUZ56_008073 [Daphnia magna]|uniref:Uncharacterized protein n=1 Tax=Daphnia magna TaxID=35525 RepID=A0ABR0ACA4_9CRUS|nr:hypothetical protein OUZ56_008073 [Daphnia magna]